MKTIRFILALLSLAFTPFVFAQTYDVDLYFNVVKNYESYKKGSKVHIKQVEHRVEYEDRYGVASEPKDSYFITDDDNRESEVRNKIGDAFQCEYKTVQNIWDSKIIQNVLSMLSKKGSQESLRDDMEQDALEYISRAKAQNSEFNDPYLENYLYSLVSKIAPTTLVDGRPGNVNLLILDDASLNAMCFPNGTVVITTGLISQLHSEGELVAVLSHEIAHFVLDHSVQNINDAEKRRKRAEFWAAVLTGVTAVAEGVAAANNQYYTPGAATLGVAMLSTIVASQVLERLGMKYNNDQEMEADEVAREVLSKLGYDSKCLSSSLSRIKKTQEKERSNAMYFSSKTHPSLISRIKKGGDYIVESNREFEQIISFAVTNTARLKYNDRRFSQCMELVDQNIKNNVGTADDYILKADCLLALKNDNQSNQQAKEMIQKAKELDPTNINIYKAEIIASLRLKQKAEAQTQLNAYLKQLGNMVGQETEYYWKNTYPFVRSETDWANRMLIKIKGM